MRLKFSGVRVGMCHGTDLFMLQYSDDRGFCEDLGLDP